MCRRPRYAVRHVVFAIGLVAVSSAVLIPVVNAATQTKRVSVIQGAGQANGLSGEPSISKDGKFVTFFSGADNIVPGDTNGESDCFVQNHITKTTELVSKDSAGTQGNHSCYGPSISGSGRRVAFDSIATNLVPGDTNDTADVFVKDRLTGSTSRISLGPGGTEGNASSNDSSISISGRYVAFASDASNLVGDDTNGTFDVFIHDTATGLTERVSVRNDGGQANGRSGDAHVSASGRYVVFNSVASDLVAGDTNGKSDIFLRDRVAHKTIRVNLGSRGIQALGGPSANPAVSKDGRYVVFDSTATNLVRGDSNHQRDVFVRDLKERKTIRVSVRSDGRQAKGASGDPTMSDSGRYISFESRAPDLAAGDTNGKWDAFVHDRVKGVTTRVSVPTKGGQANGDSDDPAISSSGRFVAFESMATNLVAGKDSNGAEDTFWRNWR